MQNRKIFIILIITIFLGLSVTIWYFLSAKKTSNPSINTPSNPFGESASNLPRSQFINQNINQTNNQTETERLPASERKLIQIWDKPVAGYSFITREIIVEATSTLNNSTTTPKKLPKPTKKTVEYLIFVDRITGYIYGYSNDIGTPFQITNTTFAGIYDAYIIQNGSRVFMRYLDNKTGIIKTVIADIPYFIEGSNPHPLTNIKYLPDNISSFSVSSSSNAYSYLVPNYYGSSVYMVNQKGNITSINSPLKEWTINYGGENPYITNKPTAYLEGSTFSLPNKKNILGNKTGLMDLPNDSGNTLLASMWSSSGLATFLLLTKTNTQKVLDIKTLSSKCVWANSNKIFCGVPSYKEIGEEGLPDEWFQGSVSFSDNLFSIDAANGMSIPIFNLEQEGGAPFDMTKLQLNKNASYLLFTNKKNASLWMININNLNNSL